MSTSFLSVGNISGEIVISGGESSVWLLREWKADSRKEGEYISRNETESEADAMGIICCEVIREGHQVQIKG